MARATRKKVAKKRAASKKPKAAPARSRAKTRTSKPKAAPKTAPVPPGHVATIAEVAAASGVHERTVKSWIAQGMPRTSDGAYSLAAIVEWRIERAARAKGNGEANGKETKNSDTAPTPDPAVDADMRYREAKARMLELTLSERLGELVPKADVERMLVDRILFTKRRLMSLPVELPQQLEGLDARAMQSVLERRIREVIERFAGTREVPDEDDVAEAS